MDRLQVSLVPLSLSSRFASAGEIPQVVHFMNRVRERTVEIILQDDIVSTDPELLEFSGYYNHPDTGEFLLLFDREKLVGTVAFAILSPDRAELRKLYLDDSLRGKRIGFTLAKYIIERAEELQIPKLQLETNTKMVDAIRLYEKLGFRKIDPPDHGGYVDILMER